MAADPARRERRERLLAAHVAAENVVDVDAVIETFSHPRYELVPLNEVYDGEAEVRRYYLEKEARGRLVYEVAGLYHSDNAVVVEVRNLSTRHPKPDRAEFPSIAIFFFDEDDLLTCERVYWDTRNYDEVNG